MIDPFELYEKHCADVNTQQGGHSRPQRNFINWVNDISLELYNELLEEFEKSSTISDKLTPFLRSLNVVITGVSGSMNDLIRKPKDYSRIAMIRAYRRGEVWCGVSGIPTCDCMQREAVCPDLLDEDELAKAQARADEALQEVECEKIDNARWGAIATRISKKADVNSPKYTQYDQGFKIMPKQLGIVVMDYFRLPVEATFKYTVINPGLENESLQYDKANSVELEWDRTLIPDFLTRLKIKYGIFVRNQQLVQHGEHEKK